MRALQGLPKRTLLLLSGRSRNGSVNTVREGALAAQLRLGILPLGTANDLARTLGTSPIPSRRPATPRQVKSVTLTSAESTAPCSRTYPSRVEHRAYAATHRALEAALGAPRLSQRRHPGPSPCQALRG
ncbi:MULTISPECIES: diacylglycerol kinase family protein [Methylorubrum]|uniref:Diacylglycerol kinase family protein n=1 Tax=Methylorubrum zatmanii TaxID=29429 RepID=A0ABW1WM57_9HYPH|nr:diacylglycerol kinase family protein [Methylorubrum populi]MBK3406610.1 hypothetical protein [Methylorubrum rhodesianum]MBY0138824.1 hypothetical protein [Methylorubrum populi]